MIRRLVLGLIGTWSMAQVHAQDAVSCEQGYGRALGLYESADLRSESLQLLDSLCNVCREDRDQMQRILFLKAVIEAQNDSIRAMRRTMERLFRNDRRYVLKPYDPLIVRLPVKEEIYNAYERLAGSRDVGPGQLRKDHGRWRAGVSVAVQRVSLRLGPEVQVFTEDEPPVWEARNGWEAGLQMEWDVVPNLALRASAAWSVLEFAARSPTLSYIERVTYMPVCLGVKKMFWLGDLPWVPHLLADISAASLVRADAEIARSGDGLRFLQPRSLDRAGERSPQVVWVGGAAGVGRKLGDVVVGVEVRYRRALQRHTVMADTYSESELLTNYYWVDRETWMDQWGANLSLQYVLRYHARNRIHS
jgi:hypothetical protein